MKRFSEKVAIWQQALKFLIVGLDIKHEHIPEDFKPEFKTKYNHERRLRDFIFHIIDLTAIHCCGWKPNLKFYEGRFGRSRLEQICVYIRKNYPGHVIILDNKDGDIGNTNIQQLEYYKYLQVDAFTMNPLMGFADSCDHYLSNPDMGVFALCLTSNKGAEDILMSVTSNGSGHPEKLFGEIAHFTLYEDSWNKNGNLHLVVGATNDPSHIATIRKQAGDHTLFLMPGYGAQGGSIETSIKAARNSQNAGFLAVVARHIFAPKLNDGEMFDVGVARQSAYYAHAFADAASAV